MLRLAAMLLATLTMAHALVAYTEPANVWRWALLMSLCQAR